MRRLTIIAKPTLLCNCACRYCITPKNIPKNKITREDIELLCQKISCSTIYDYFTFIWHGGEPLLMGVDFYKDIFSIQEKTIGRDRFRNTFQTNCTLINDEWMDFFIENRLMVSASLDGDRESHDVNRIKNNQGTFDDVFRIIKQLQSARLLTGVVTVLSKSNISKVEKFLEFFASNNISPRLNPILPSERVLSNESDLSISAMEYADCLIKCYDNWVSGKYNDSNGKPLRIAPLTDIIHNFYRPERPRPCVFSTSCSDNFLSINPVGDLFNCGRFCDIAEYKIANIHDDFDNIDSILELKRKTTQWNLPVPADDECLNCEWLSVCNRGCPNSSFIFSGNIMSKDPFCEGYKKVFAHIYNHLKSKLNNE